MGNRASTEAEPPPPPEDATEEQQMSYYQMIKQGYQELVNAIVRPPRCRYDETHLGPKEFMFCRKKFHRVDFDLTNKRNLNVKCSIWEPLERPNEIMPCVIYMHGNSSARVEALPQLSLVLSLGATMVSFDFAGSGKSGGEYVSLGYFEKDDLDCVIEHLRNAGRTSTIALWGRSMGAATALLHGERDPSIAGMVLDSAFASLTMLAEEMVEKGKEHGVNVPGFVVRLAIRWIRSSVQKMAGFDIHDLTPIEHADKCVLTTLSCKR
jgi:pimeloyl-ACP methyl ester carboxylesterase